MQSVVFCFDKNYSKYCRVALLSLILSNGRDFKVYTVHAGDVDWYDLNALTLLCANFNIELIFIRVSPSDVKGMVGWGYFSPAVFLRLLLPDLLKNEKRVLYLDCDLIINGSLADLFDMDMGSFKYAGVIDVEGARSSRLDPMFKMDYINSGVLLINLEALRGDSSFEKMLCLYQNNKDKLLWVDQCLINMYACESKILLDNKYNCLVRSDAILMNEWELVKKKGLVYHFIGAVKPWHSYCREHVFNFWWSYANLLNANDLKSIEPKTIKELLLQCNSLEEYKKFEKSIEIKNIIINDLIGRIRT